MKAPRFWGRSKRSPAQPENVDTEMEAPGSPVAVDIEFEEIAQEKPRRKIGAVKKDKKTHGKVYVAAELYAGSVNLWDIEDGKATIVSEENLDKIQSGWVIGFTSKHAVSARKASRKEARSAFLGALEAKPVMVRSGQYLYASTKLDIARYTPVRVVSGPMLLVHAAGRKAIKPNSVIGWYADGDDPIAACYFVDKDGRFLGPVITTDISENGLSENARQAVTSLGNIDPREIAVKWVPLSDLTPLITKIPAYPIAGELWGRPATFWAGGIAVIGAACFAFSVADKALENSSLEHVQQQLATERIVTPKRLHAIEAVYQRHLGLAAQKSSVAYWKGIRAAMDIWQPYTIETLSMSKVAPSRRSPLMANTGDGNTILLTVTPYLAGGQDVRDKVWVSEKTLLRRLSVKAPSGYRPGQIFTRQKGEEYEIVFRKK